MSASFVARSHLALFPTLVPLLTSLLAWLLTARINPALGLVMVLRVRGVHRYCGFGRRIFDLTVVKNSIHPISYFQWQMLGLASRYLPLPDSYGRHGNLCSIVVVWPKSADDDVDDDE